MFRSGFISGVKCLAGVLAALMLLSACQTPEVNTNPPGASPLQSPSAAASSPPVTIPSPTVSIPSSPAPVPTRSSATTIAGKANVLMKDDGTGILSMDMSVAAFHKAAAALGWSCSPKNGTDKYGIVTAGPNQFLFYDGKLNKAYIADRAFSTERGLRVGDSVATMKRLYGEPDAKYSVPDGGGVDYNYPLTETLSMGATVKSGKIVGIGFG